MTEANPKLLSLLEKLQHPIEKVTVELGVQGVFAFPEEWKTADDANPTLFTYKVKFLGQEVKDGKIMPRQLTEKEIKEQEELAAAKQKKAAKKQDKQPEVQLTPEEEEAIRLKKLEEEEKERIRQEEWDKLDEETKFYRTYEDKFKQPSLQFENKVAAGDKEGQDLVILEERMYRPPISLWPRLALKQPGGVCGAACVGGSLPLATHSGAWALLARGLLRLAAVFCFWKGAACVVRAKLRRFCVTPAYFAMRDVSDSTTRATGSTFRRARRVLRKKSQKCGRPSRRT